MKQNNAPQKSKKTIAIIGGGAASLLCADVLSTHFHVTIYEKGAAIGKKFLVAGKGGFNLSHQCSLEKLTKYYSPSGFLDEALTSFPPDDLRKWYTALDIPTFVGTSHRIFPISGISPADVLRKIKKKLVSQGVAIKTHHEFVGFSPHAKPVFKNKELQFELLADFYIFSLGGASWKVTGSDGKWISLFTDLGIKAVPFAPSNCGLNISWPPEITNFHIGKPLKNIEIAYQDTYQKGEAILTEYGMEGNAVYPISSVVRNAFSQGNPPIITLDLKPQLSEKQLYDKIKNCHPSNYAKHLNLSSVQLSLIKMVSSKEDYLNPEIFVKFVKSVPVQIESLRPMDEAISTVGGIECSELNANFTLKKFPNMACIGEMVNWDAPTGGFLLQSCFSMGFYIAESLINSVLLEEK